MSFALPPVRPTSEGPSSLKLQTGPFGVPEALKFGLSTVKSSVEIHHPLELSEKNYSLNQEAMHMSILRNTQGIHAPIRLKAELRAVEPIGRLPFLPSSGLMKATLQDLDSSIDFSDFLGQPEMDERLVIPHVAVEHSLGILN